MARQATAPRHPETTRSPALLIGTAGHIDHGKSTLVQALTGTDPDRLPEEKRRGISIELGFASGTLASGIDASFVDVPGHERFVRTMVAGAHAVDVVLLAVALDEGVMPQTREHADVCRLLGVPRAVVALTRSDLAGSMGADWQALVTADVRSLGPPFDDAEVVAVSARTGEGLDLLREALVRAGSHRRRRSTNTPALLPIDRAFTLKGHGTVVTGTLLSGALTTDDAVELISPAPRDVLVTADLRVRALQNHGRTVARAASGQRVAVNVPGLEVSAIPRGSVLAAAGTGAIRSTSLLDVELELVRDAPALPSRTRTLLHLGTAQALAVVDLLGRDHLVPGERAVAQLRLDRALPALRDQRFVLRGFRTVPGGGRTLGGGRVLALDDRRRRTRDRGFVENLLGDVEAALRSQVCEAGAAGLPMHSALLRLGLDAAPASVVGLGERLFDPASLDSIVEPLRERIRKQPEMTPEQARASFSPSLDALAFSWVLERLGPGFAVGETLRFEAPSPESLVDDPLGSALSEILAGAGLTPPTVDELATKTGRSSKDVLASLRRLAKDARAVRLSEKLFLGADAAADFRKRVVAAIGERGSLTTTELKEIAGTSRKFAIPLCEWLDRERVTLRVGDKRVLRRG